MPGEVMGEAGSVWRGKEGKGVFRHPSDLLAWLERCDPGSLGGRKGIGPALARGTRGGSNLEFLDG